MTEQVVTYPDLLLRKHYRIMLMQRIVGLDNRSKKVVLDLLRRNVDFPIRMLEFS